MIIEHQRAFAEPNSHAENRISEAEAKQEALLKNAGKTEQKWLFSVSSHWTPNTCTEAETETWQGQLTSRQTASS